MHSKYPPTLQDIAKQYQARVLMKRVPHSTGLRDRFTNMIAQLHHVTPHDFRDARASLSVLQRYSMKQCKLPARWWPLMISKGISLPLLPPAREGSYPHWNTTKSVSSLCEHAIKWNIRFLDFYRFWNVFRFLRIKWNIFKYNEINDSLWFTRLQTSGAISAQAPSRPCLQRMRPWEDRSEVRPGATRPCSSGHNWWSSTELCHQGSSNQNPRHPRATQCSSEGTLVAMKPRNHAATSQSPRRKKNHD